MKKTIAIFMSLCILLSLTACSQKAEKADVSYAGQATQNTSAGDTQSQVQSSMPTKEGWLMTRVDMPAKMPALVGMDNDGDWLWLSGRGKVDDVWHLMLLGLDTVNGEWKQIALGPEDIGISDDYDIRLVAAYSLSVCDHMAWMCVDCTSSDYSLMVTKLITVDTVTGEVNSTEWAWEKAFDSTDEYLIAIDALDRDRALLLTGSEAAIIDHGFNPLAHNHIDAYMFSEACKIGDRLYLTSDDGVTQFDTQNLCLGKTLKINVGGIPYSMGDSQLGNILFSSGNKLYSLEPSGKMNVVFDWMDVALSRETASPALFENSKGELYGCANEDGLVLVRVSRAEIPIKDTLTMACFFDTKSTNAQTRMTGDMANALLAFNNSDELYRIVPVYYDYAGEEDLTRVLIEAFSSDIDLVDQSNLPEGRISGAQLLDMLPFLDADPELDRDDFFPAAFRSMSVGGHMYRVSPYYSVLGLNVPTKLYPGSTEWSCSFLREAIAEEPTLALGEGKNYTSDFVVNAMAHAVTGEFIDLENMSCNFIRQDFAEWLKLMKCLVDRTGLASDQVRFTCDIVDEYCFRGIEDRSDYATVTSHQIVGFPNSKGNGYYLASPAAVVAIEGEYKGFNTSLSIAKGCKNEQAAWNFAKQLLYHTQLGIPVLRSVFEDMMAFYSRNYEMSKQDIDTLRNIAENAAGTVIADPSLIVLITGELNAYLQGEKSADAVSEQLQRRVGIYLSERD